MEAVAESYVQEKNAGRMGAVVHVVHVHMVVRAINASANLSSFPFTYLVDYVTMQVRYFPTKSPIPISK